jgi:GTP-binding protein Era
MDKKIKAGYVAITGRPNTGKSTFLNRLCKTKISITSPRAQTTRNRIVGIVTGDDYQAVFLDTPGIMKEKSQMNRMMTGVSSSASEDADLILFFIDADRVDLGADKYAISRLSQSKKPRFLVVNKIDIIKKPTLLRLIDKAKELCDFEEIVPISAKNGENVDHLLALIKEKLPEGYPFYDKFQVTDQPEKFVLSELVRERTFYLLQQELPYAMAVTIDEVTERDNGLVYVAGTIYVERPSQKVIVIGKKGAMLKKIGRGAREEMEKRFGNKVYLELFVKIQKGWTGSKQNLIELGHFDHNR